MRRLYILLCLVILFVFSGCKADNLQNNNPGSDNASDNSVALNDDSKPTFENSNANSSVSSKPDKILVVKDYIADIDTPYDTINFTSNVYIGEVIEVSKTPLFIEKNVSKFNLLDEVDRFTFEEYYNAKKEAEIKVRVKEVFKGNHKADTVINDRVRYEFVDLLESGKTYLLMTGIDYCDSLLLNSQFFGTPAYNAMLVHEDNSLSFLKPWDKYNVQADSGVYPLTVGYFKGVLSPLSTLSENIAYILKNEDFEINCDALKSENIR